MLPRSLSSCILCGNIAFSLHCTYNVFKDCFFFSFCAVKLWLITPRTLWCLLFWGRIWFPGKTKVFYLYGHTDDI